jgi:hypothetical protein
MVGPRAAQSDLIESNTRLGHRLFDQIRSMLPPDGRIGFHFEGQDYEAASFSRDVLFINNMTHRQLGYVPLNGDKRAFPGGEEKLAQLLTVASARLQEITS